MQVCNARFNSSVSKCIQRKIIVIFSILLGFSFYGYSQALEMPELTMPEFPSMPEVTSTRFGDDNFYRPELPNFGNGKLNEENRTDSSTKNDLIFSSADSTDDFIKSLLYGNNVLSAKDISSLSDAGLFDSLSSLENTNYSILSQTSPTDVLLKQILYSLDDLKKEHNKNSMAQNEQEKDLIQDSQNFKRRTPSILRFVINGYDMTPSLATVFFSEAEDDGSFLMTGDRKYYSDRKNHSETFYLLFKAEKKSNAALSYSVCPSVVQDIKNEKSFLYQMAQKNDITASKTGNLVVVHYGQNNWNMDLLLDIDCKGKQ